MNIEKILEKHDKLARWLKGGERACLHGADLCEADLRGANLREADLREADLREAYLRGADLRGADLRRANLWGADLCEADLRGANLYKANLRGAKNVSSAFWDHATAFFQLQCPEIGAFIGWKKASRHIIKLEITENAKRSSATTRKCRCSEARVIAIENIDGSNSGLQEVSSNYDSNFVYRVGQIVKVDNFDEDRWNECAPGIHFFITREEAVKYN